MAFEIIPDAKIVGTVVLAVFPERWLEEWL